MDFNSPPADGDFGRLTVDSDGSVGSTYLGPTTVAGADLDLLLTVEHTRDLDWDPPSDFLLLLGASVDLGLVEP